MKKIGFFSELEQKFLTECLLVANLHSIYLKILLMHTKSN